MSNKHDTTSEPNGFVIYQIRLKGHLNQEWTEWFGGGTITLQEDGNTLLTCPLTDQAALFGLLKKVRDLGIPLISITPAQPDQEVNNHNQQEESK